MRDTFIQKFINGETSLDKVDDFIDDWHENGDTRSLHEAIGLTWEEYKIWAPNPELLSNIVEQRKEF